MGLTTWTSAPAGSVSQAKKQNSCSIRINQETIILRSATYDGGDVVALLKQGYAPDLLIAELGENWEEIPDWSVLHKMSKMFTRLLQTPDYEQLFYKIAVSNLDFNDHQFKDASCWFDGTPPSDMGPSEYIGHLDNGK